LQSTPAAHASTLFFTFCILLIRGLKKPSSASLHIFDSTLCSYLPCWLSVLRAVPPARCLALCRWHSPAAQSGSVWVLWSLRSPQGPCRHMCDVPPYMALDTACVYRHIITANEKHLLHSLHGSSDSSTSCHTQHLMSGKTATFVIIRLFYSAYHPNQGPKKNTNI